MFYGIKIGHCANGTLSHHPYWRPFNLLSYSGVSSDVRLKGTAAFTDPLLL